MQNLFLLLKNLNAFFMPVNMLYKLRFNAGLLGYRIYQDVNVSENNTFTPNDPITCSSKRRVAPIKTYHKSLEPPNETQYVQWGNNPTNETFLQNKKIISISPGGYKGFYMLGICAFIKDHYNLDDYIFSGASAGAWNALMMTFKYNISTIKPMIIDNDFKNIKSMNDLEKKIKSNILMSYSTDDFDLRRVFVGVTTIQHYRINTTIFSGFQDLEDAIECCIASSHIPYVTGNLINKYNDIYTFDGGFSKYPYLDVRQPVLHITPGIWLPKQTTKIEKLQEYKNYFSNNMFDFEKLFDYGYENARKNKDFLDKIFISVK